MCFGKHRLDDTKDLNVDQSSCLSNGTSDIRHTQFCGINYWYENIVAELDTQQAQAYCTDANVSKQSKKRNVVNSLMYPSIMK